jgi:hypothetical protein
LTTGGDSELLVEPSVNVEFLRWRADRWMKLRHMPAAFAHNPLFLLRNAPKMFAAHLSRQHDPLIPRA